ncbi:MAG TPA: UPF0149 family protein [Steroidobacteraceae bacterium]|nr:UPF0149 family protein [Steroidobacteraceae bacterium]HRX88583.1 UPF0149 family protein [Steroidobacteraceae bacterium]
MKNLYQPLDDDELTRLDDFLLDRLDLETAEEIAAAGGDEGILDVTELDGLLTAIVSGPNVIVPSRWLPVVWGADEPVWESMEQFQDIFGLMMRHQNFIADMLLHQRDAFEPVFGEHVVDDKTYLVVDEWCHGYMRGLELDAYAWSAGGQGIDELLRPIRLWGTEEGWLKVDVMDAAAKQRERDAITPSVREIYEFWLERRARPTSPVRRAAPRVGRNDPCPCGSGKKYKHCCLQ